MKSIAIRKQFDGGYYSTWTFCKGTMGDFYATSNTGKRMDFASEVAFEKCLAAYLARGFAKRTMAPIVRKGDVAETTAETAETTTVKTW